MEISFCLEGILLAGTSQRKLKQLEIRVQLLESAGLGVNFSLVSDIFGM